MKKFALAPALLLLVCSSFVACGKTDSTDPASSQPVVTDPAPYPTYSGQPAPADFNSWCQQRGGFYYATQAVCKIQEITQFGWNMYWGAVDTHIPVFMNDTVSIIVSGSANAWVGNGKYPASSTFVAQSQGSLVIKGRHQSGFKIKSIQLTRCYNHNGQSVQCP